MREAGHAEDETPRTWRCGDRRPASRETLGAALVTFRRSWLEDRSDQRSIRTIFPGVSGANRGIVTSADRTSEVDGGVAVTYRGVLAKVTLTLENPRARSIVLSMVRVFSSARSATPPALAAVDSLFSASR